MRGPTQKTKRKEAFFVFLIEILVCFPVLIGILLCICKKELIQKLLVYGSSGIIVVTALVLAAQNFFVPSKHIFAFNTEWVDISMLIVEIMIGLYIFYIGIKKKRYYASLLSVIQITIILWLELSGKTELSMEYHIYIDKLAIIMGAVIAVVGSLICIYAVGYMKQYHKHHKEVEDRRAFFLGLLFIFLGAMFGLVFSGHLMWMLFFWEVTTFCSFLLIGYTKSEEAITNSFRALWMNLLGGIAFTIAVAYCSMKFQMLDINDILLKGKENPDLLIIPVLFLSFAALIKSAQLPFSRWLLGAMVAPTPSSALLHSATMVKAGVYLLIRLSPALNGSIAGFMVTTVGGFTFLMASLLAISQRDAKKLLAYSTVANLGLIAACAGVGTTESIWAAVLLVVFHAVSKSLMFLSVGAVENITGSRDIEDMHGLIVKLPEMALVLIIGIAGMFLAPFGMLISKWAALKSFVDSNSMLLIFFLIFGSAATLFYWTKWISKLVAVLHNSERIHARVKGSEWFSLLTHAVIMVALCVLFPLISANLIEPYLMDLFGIDAPMVIRQGNINIMAFMLATIAVIPFAIRFLTFSRHNKIVPSYMAGVNEGDDRSFVDSFGEKKKMYLANWYMEAYFGEKRLLKPAILSTGFFIGVIIIVGVGGVL